MNRRPWFGITGRREAIRPYVDTSKSVLGARPQVLRRGGERVSARHVPRLAPFSFWRFTNNQMLARNDLFLPQKVEGIRRAVC